MNFFRFCKNREKSQKTQRKSGLFRNFLLRKSWLSNQLKGLYRNEKVSKDLIFEFFINSESLLKIKISESNKHKPRVIFS